MAYDFEDDDHTEFIRFEGTGNEDKGDHVLSRAAFELHSFGMMNSVRDGNPGFISDDYLNNIAAETTLTAMELISAGLWERSTDGYRVIDSEMLEMVLDANERMKNVFPHEPEDCPGPQSRAEQRESLPSLRCRGRAPRNNLSRSLQ